MLAQANKSIIQSSLCIDISEYLNNLKIKIKLEKINNIKKSVKT